MPNIRIYPNEEFKEFTPPHKLKLRYAVSNKGRLLSFTKDIKEGRILKGSYSDGYKMFKYKIFKEGKITYHHLFMYKLVAEHFLLKTNENQTHVLHLDRVRDNDDVNNLRWATREEMLKFTQNSPFVKQAFKNLQEFNIKSDGAKLSVTRVIHIKKILAKPNLNTRLKMIAKQFGVSEMQIRRIKSGENWGHIKI